MEDIKKYPILYKKDKTGKIRQWQIIIEKTKDGFQVYTISGVKGSPNLIKSESTFITEGKQKRTPLEQSILEANRKYKLQFRNNYREEINGSEKIFVKPYLLKNFNEHSSKIKYPAFIQPKLDGVRSLLGWYTEDNGEKLLKFTSRSSREFTNPLTHIKDEVIKYKLIPNDKFFLDGELYNHQLSLHEINGIVNKKKLTIDDDKKSLQIQFHIFDYLDLNKPNEGYETRYKKLQEIFSKIKPQYLYLLNQDDVSSYDDAVNKANKYVSIGYEGAVIRNKHFKYKQTRIVDVQKIKKFLDDEFLIVDIIGGVKGRGVNEARFILETSDGEQFKATFKGTHEEREDILKNKKKYIGMKATVRFQEYAEKKLADGTVRRVPRDGRVTQIRTDI